MTAIADARRYCRVVTEGPVTQGDGVVVLVRMPATPPEPGRAAAPADAV